MHHRLDGRLSPNALLLSAQDDATIEAVPFALFEPADYIPGTPGDDTLTGTDGRDKLDGGAGADVMSGGGKADTYIVDNVGDVVIEAWQKRGADKVLASVDYTLSAYVEKLLLTGSADLRGTGNELDNWIEGNRGDNVLRGEAGDDDIYGGDGNDSIHGGDGWDWLVGGDGDDELWENEGFAHGGNGNDTMRGTGALFGEAGADKLVVKEGSGGGGLYGGADNDLLLGGLRGDTLQGGTGIDTMIGGSGNDVLWDDDDAADTLDGGDGVDKLLAGWTTMTTGLVWTNQSTTMTQIVNGNEISSIEGMELGLGSGDDVVSNFGHIGHTWLRGGAGNDILTAGDGGEILAGEIGNDLLNGGAGAGTLDGGSGNDTMYGGGGHDELEGGSGQDALYAGDGNDDVIDEDGEAGTIDGGAGFDRLIGWVVDNAGVHWVNDPNAVLTVGNKTISGIEALAHVSLGAAADYVSNENVVANDHIGGGDGNDTLLGGTGHDMLEGAGGNDIVRAEGSGTLSGGDGSDLLDGSAGTDATGFSLWGSFGDDTMQGGAGSDYASGDQGNDLIDTGAGHDEIYVRSGDGFDTINGGNGTDELSGTWLFSNQAINWRNDPSATQQVGNFTVTGIETIDLTCGSGNDLVTNLLTASDDEISGFEGNDTFEGGAGNDWLDGSDGSDVLTGGAGDDTVEAGINFSWVQGIDTIVLDSLIGSDRVREFESETDLLRISQAGLPVGDADAVIEGATKIAAPGGYAAAAELVIATANIAGELSAAAAAARIGNASSAFAAGQTAVFVVDNGIDTGVYYFESAGADAAVSADELTLLAVLEGTDRTIATDYAFSA